jgi:hypothetical protein
VISGFRRDVDDISAILGYDASSKVKKSWFLDPWKLDQLVLPKRRYLTTIVRCEISLKRIDLKYTKISLQRKSCPCPRHEGV